MATKKIEEYKVMVVSSKTVWASTPEEAEQKANHSNGDFTAIYAEPVSLYGKRYNTDAPYGHFKKMCRWIVDYVSTLSHQRKDYDKRSKHFKTFPVKAGGCVARPQGLDEEV